MGQPVLRQLVSGLSSNRVATNQSDRGSQSWWKKSSTQVNCATVHRQHVCTGRTSACGEAGAWKKFFFWLSIRETASKDWAEVVRIKNGTSGIKFWLEGDATINSRQSPGLGNAQSGCSDMLRAARRCAVPIYARPKLPSVQLRGNTDRSAREEAMHIV